MLAELFTKSSQAFLTPIKPLIQPQALFKSKRKTSSSFCLA